MNARVDEGAAEAGREPSAVRRIFNVNGGHRRRVRGVPARAGRPVGGRTGESRRRPPRRHPRLLGRRRRRTRAAATLRRGGAPATRNECRVEASSVPPAACPAVRSRAWARSARSMSARPSTMSRWGAGGSSASFNQLRIVSAISASASRRGNNRTMMVFAVSVVRSPTGVGSPPGTGRHRAGPARCPAGGNRRRSPAEALGSSSDSTVCAHASALACSVGRAAKA